MKGSLTKVSIFLGLALVFTVYNVSSSEEVVAVPKSEPKVAVFGELPVVSARAFAIFDGTTGEVIASTKAEEILPIASVTKLITAAAVTRYLDPDNQVVVIGSDLDGHGRAGRLSVDQKYTNYELLFPLLLESSNDVASVYERTTDGEIVTKMNSLVSGLGAKETTLADASGLSDRNVSSARDLAKVAFSLRQSDPHIFDISQLSKRVGPYVAWANNSPVWSDDYLGGKHGFTEAAGRTLVAFFKEDQVKPGQVFGYVLLGSDDLASDIRELRGFVRDSVRYE